MSMPSIKTCWKKGKHLHLNLITEYDKNNKLKLWWYCVICNSLVIPLNKLS